MNNLTINSCSNLFKCCTNAASLFQVKKQLLLFLTFLFIGLYSVNAQCPDHNTSLCDGQKVEVNVDSLPFCDEGSTSIEGDITNNGGNPSSCLDEDGNACFEFKFFRAENSATESFTFDVGQGQGCTGELDASWFFYDGLTGCSVLSTGGSQTMITFDFPTGVDEVYLYLCINSSRY